VKLVTLITFQMRINSPDFHVDDETDSSELEQSGNGTVSKNSTHAAINSNC
jgi:hypothetical protein